MIATAHFLTRALFNNQHRIEGGVIIMCKMGVVSIMDVVGQKSFNNKNPPSQVPGSAPGM